MERTCIAAFPKHTQKSPTPSLLSVLLLTFRTEPPLFCVLLRPLRFFLLLYVYTKNMLAVSRKRKRDLNIIGRRRAGFARRYTVLTPALTYEEDVDFVTTFTRAFSGSGAEAFYTRVMTSWPHWKGFKKHEPHARFAPIAAMENDDTRLCGCLAKADEYYATEESKLGARIYKLDAYDTFVELF